MNSINFWDNQDRSSTVIQELNNLKDIVKDISLLDKGISDLTNMVNVDVDIDCCHSCYLFYYCITNIVKTMNLVNKNCTFLCKISFTNAKNLS